MLARLLARRTVSAAYIAHGVGRKKKELRMAVDRAKGLILSDAR